MESLEKTNQQPESSQTTVKMQEIVSSTQRIEEELKKVNAHKVMKIYNSIPQLLLFHLLKGIAFGLGSVLGATIVVSIVIYLLSQIEFIPIIGEWVERIIQEIKNKQ